jgi:hypothetical protein
VVDGRLASPAAEQMEAVIGPEWARAECDGGVSANVGATQRGVLTALDGPTTGVTATVAAATVDDVRVDFKGDDQPQGVKESKAIR